MFLGQRKRIRIEKYVGSKQINKKTNSAEIWILKIFPVEV